MLRALKGSLRRAAQCSLCLIDNVWSDNRYSSLMYVHKEIQYSALIMSIQISYSTRHNYLKLVVRHSIGASN